ncbi:hypothetical protein O181_015810 [Austropuccinia psidii MF-1]|uniref:PAN2-PAN3 deadenylation complex catalytic subunit PAN2 n=1 Tax=Austropuccinia psidii MF-1 TaxID=1389203 RepID=A0A9Q3GRA8_9BASI|nr:hypothetical protein [Austropuccinia psidii MF-1]
MLSAPWKPFYQSFLPSTLNLKFDSYYDLLWSSNANGTIFSHLLPKSPSATVSTNSSNPSGINNSNSANSIENLKRYSSFKSSNNLNSSINQFILTQSGVFSLNQKSLKFTNRRGLPIWYTDNQFQDAQSMTFTPPKSIEILIGGGQPELILLNASNGHLVRRIEINLDSSFTLNSFNHLNNSKFSSITHLRKFQNLICCGSQSGKISLRDPTDLKEQHSITSHYAGLDQLETEGNYLVTSGFSLKQGHPVRDPLVKVFDIRALKPLPPITFPSIPAHLRFHPRMPSTLFITSSIGQLQILDLANPLPTSSFYQLEVASFITDLCISNSGEGLAYSEANGMIHLWTTTGGLELNLVNEDFRNDLKPVKWTRSALPIEFPDPIDSTPQIEWSDETPLSLIGMPYYSTQLFSVLPYETYITPYSPIYQPRPILDSELNLPIHQKTSQQQSNKNLNEVFDGGGNRFDKVQYLPNPKKTKRYQASLPSQSSNLFSIMPKTVRVGSRPSKLMDQKSNDLKNRLMVPLFRSEKEKEKAKGLNQVKRNQAEILSKEYQVDVDDDLELKLSLEGLEDMPKWYRQVEIKYSKFGIEDFDFGFYNNTKYSGLETHIMNSYTNSLLQILYHTIPVRKVAESHITSDCSKLNCMLCELGFLFKMLDDAQGVNCQTSNFSKAFSINQRAIALELMDHQHQDLLNSNSILHRTNDQPGNPKPLSISNKSYSSLIQLCHHFLLDQISEDSSKAQSQHNSLRHQPVNIQVKTTKTSTSVATISNNLLSSPIIDIFSTRWQTNQTCPSCHHQTSRTTFTKVIEMVYPRKALSNEPKPMTDFCSILKNSMIRDTTAKSLCLHCNQHTHQRWKRQPDDEGLGNELFPTVLALNAGVTNSEQLEIWLDNRVKLPQSAPGFKNPIEDLGNNINNCNNNRFLQSEIGVSIQTVSSEVSSIVIGDGNPIRIPENSIRYELRGLIVQIQSDDETPHLVSLIKVTNEDEVSKFGKSTTGWYLFNDFLVKKISEEEALSFPARWKIPCILYYVRKDMEKAIDLSRLPSSIDRSILLKDINLSKFRDLSKIRHEILTEDELPKQGDLVAIDAEFVSLQQEEVDYKSDGTRVVRRPSRMSLARVSVLRGGGSKTGVPFVDDHIQTFEPITDYLTEYSGIRPGDLDPHASPHTLVPLKVAYKKLRLLVDLGCIFIGHGLSKDFRIINIHVPPSQIIDTVNLYYIPSRQRRLSLRLLSYLILKHDIQNAGMHDSIEDARTALKLYDIYRQLNNEGVWQDELENVYRKGKEMGWKVPGADKAQSITTAPALSSLLSDGTLTKETLTNNPTLTTVASSIKSNPVTKVSRSTLSATSASYFPIGISPVPKPIGSRSLQPIRHSPNVPSSSIDHLTTLNINSSAPFFGGMTNNIQPTFSPPLSNYINNNSLPIINQNSELIYNNHPTPTNSSTSIFQKFASNSSPIFEPKKKLLGFNPMAPSFVHSSPNHRTINSPNNQIFNNNNANLINNSNTSDLNKKPQANLPLEMFQTNNNQNQNHYGPPTTTLNEFFPFHHHPPQPAAQHYHQESPNFLPLPNNHHYNANGDLKLSDTTSHNNNNDFFKKNSLI